MILVSLVAVIIPISKRDMIRNKSLKIKTLKVVGIKKIQ